MVAPPPPRPRRRATDSFVAVEDRRLGRPRLCTTKCQQGSHRGRSHPTRRRRHNRLARRCVAVAIGSRRSSSPHGFTSYRSRSGWGTELIRRHPTFTATTSRSMTAVPRIRCPRRVPVPKPAEAVGNVVNLFSRKGAANGGYLSEVRGSLCFAFAIAASGASFLWCPDGKADSSLPRVCDPTSANYNVVQCDKTYG